MAEQQSRRANNVTGVDFQGAFETSVIRYGSGTLNLKDSLDAMEGWSRHTNVWQEHEGEATARPGETSLASHSGTCHSIKKMRDPEAGTLTRFWGVDSHLEMGASGGGTVASGFSGNPLALLPHRPPLTGEPWMFVGDSNKMIKVRGDGLVIPIGLPAPSSPVSTQLGTEHRKSIAMCDSSDGTASAAWTGVPGKDANGVPTGVPTAPGINTERPPSSPGIYCETVPGKVTRGYDSWWGIGVSRDLTKFDDGNDVVDNDIIHVLLKGSKPALFAEMRIYIVVSATFDPRILPGTVPPTGMDFFTNSDAYVKAFRPSDYVQFVQANQAQVDAAEAARINALRDKDSESRGFDDTRVSWEDLRAQSDPARARSYTMGVGNQQWFVYGVTGSSLRRMDFQRIGSTEGRDWSTVTGIIFYVRTLDPVGSAGSSASGGSSSSVGASPPQPVAIAMAELYITGGSGPDSIQPGALSYDYRVTNYDPRTGCESNPSKEQPNIRSDDTGLTNEQAPLDSSRRDILVSPPAYGDGAIRQRVYRRGGALFDDWYYCGTNTSDGGVFTDTNTDDDVTAAGTVAINHYQPVPTVDEAGNEVLAQAVPALWGPVAGLLFACGDPHRPGHVYYCIAGQPDHWDAFGVVEVCSPSEELLNGGVSGQQAFVFSRQRLYFLYPGLGGYPGFGGSAGTLVSAPSQCTRGPLGRWAFCTGPGGLIFFVAADGVFSTSGGPESWLSEKINPLFLGVAVNGYQPIDKTHVNAIRLTTYQNCLYFQYDDTAGHRNVLVYSLLLQFWRHYSFAQSPSVLEGEADADLLLLGCAGASYTLGGTSDSGAAIPCTIRTGSASGGRREEKLFGDIFLDADPNGNELSLQVFLNEESVANSVIAIGSASSGRQRFLVHAFGDNPQKAHSIATELTWSTSGAPPTIYQIGYAITLQPDLTNTRVTNWDDLNSPDEVWLTGLTLDCDTGGLDKEIHIERDFAGQRFDVDAVTVNCANRHKVKFSWPAVPANMVRIRPDEGDCVPWLLYRADWIYQEEPPRIAHWDIHYENNWDQYYTGLDLYCDTFGATKQIEVWVDEVRLVNTLAGNITYWPVTTNGRRVVHLTLPWGRGHVFRFLATDENPGLLYTHRWFLDHEPSEQANWNQNFSILGTRADKWLKAVIFECDTYGQDKSVNIEADQVVVETLTVNTTGRTVVQLALSQQQLGRVWRVFPVDSNPGRLYSIEPVFDEEPFALTRWETQETNHSLPGWFYPLYAQIVLKSTADVTLTTVMQHNQQGDTTTNSYTISATGGVKQRRFLPGFLAGKGVLIKYILTSSDPFWLYRDETTVTIQPWGNYQSITVQPFGNDDLDPSRPMTHAVLAAEASGGVAQAAS